MEKKPIGIVYSMSKRYLNIRASKRYSYNTLRASVGFLDGAKLEDKIKFFFLNSGENPESNVWTIDFIKSKKYIRKNNDRETSIIELEHKKFKMYDNYSDFESAVFEQANYFNKTHTSKVKTQDIKSYLETAKKYFV